MELTYNYYKETYLGDIIPSENDFKRAVRDARVILQHMVHMDPPEELKDSVHMCLCEAAELIYQSGSRKKKHEGREIQSENIDGYSVTYTSSADSETVEMQVYGVIRKHLARTGLLYLGVNCHDYKCGDYHF